MLNKEEEKIKAKILNENNQDKIIEIYKNENVTMNIVNDKEVIEHVSKYVKIQEDEKAGHVYIRKVENATKEYLNYANKRIEEIALTNK